MDMFLLSWTVVSAQGEWLEIILVDKLSKYRKNRWSFESGDVISQTHYSKIAKRLLPVFSNQLKRKLC